MDCYVLNSSFAAEVQVDGWFSFIWTERYKSPSEFRIELPNTSYYRNLLKIDAILMISESTQPMVIETFYVKKTQQGEIRYVVEGRDLTTWMEFRDAPWDTSYSAARVSDIAFNIMAKTIVNGNSYDKLPNVTISNNATDGAKFDYETTPGSLLENVQGILDDNNCAVRAVRIGSPGSYSFRYQIYNGTSKNVVFSDRDDTLINTQRVQSKKKLRNVATVAYKASNKEDAKTLYRQVYANGGSSGATGLNRRVLRVDATTINPNDYPGTRLNTALDRMGRAALGKQTLLSAVDGEVPAYSQFKYGTHYNLGDIVKFKSDDNVLSDARISEYIWIEDGSGARDYPTIDPTASQSV